MELAVIGSPTFVLGFKLAGVRKTEVDKPAAINDAVRTSMRDADVGILVMETPDLHKLDPALRRQLEASVRPTLVSIGVEEDTDLREKLKSALGVDLWK
jgi:V/A-type H+/Na+-transporting ATPase subunit F